MLRRSGNGIGNQALILRPDVCRFDKPFMGEDDVTRGIWVLLAAVVVIGAGYFVFYGKDAPDSPTAATSEGAAAPADGTMVSVALPATLSGKAEIGKAIFEAKCAVCHGENAGGLDGSAPPLVHRIYEPNHHPDGAFLVAAQNGVRSHHWAFGDMPPVKGVTPAEVGNVVAYIRELQRNNGIQ